MRTPLFRHFYGPSPLCILFASISRKTKHAIIIITASHITHVLEELLLKMWYSTWGYETKRQRTSEYNIINHNYSLRQAYVVVKEQRLLFYWRAPTPLGRWTRISEDLCSLVHQHSLSPVRMLVKLTNNMWQSCTSIHVIQCRCTNTCTCTFICTWKVLVLFLTPSLVRNLSRQHFD